MNNKTNPLTMSTRLFFLWWSLANLLGFGLAGAFFHNFPLAFTFPPDITHLGAFSLAPAITGGVLFGAVPALLIGWLQRVVLRRHLPVSRWWILAASAGVGLMHFLSDGFENARDLSVAVLAGGLAAGALQWLLLRPHLPSPVWCIPANVAGWNAGWAIGIAMLSWLGLLYLPWIGGLDFKQHGVLGIALGTGYSVATGPVLLGLMRKRAH